MPDWTSSMTHSFEYYVVDPSTWKDVKLLDNVTSCSITRDSELETLGSASFDVAESVGETYIRAYLITIQNGIRERFPLGTYLAQTPSSSFDGRIRSVSMDGYTPLLELKENLPPIGYSVLKEDKILDIAYSLARENARAPVVKATDSTVLHNDFIADPSDTWLSFLTELIRNAKYNFDLDEMGRILFSPKQSTASLQPVWTYTDDNSSILYPSISVDHDIYEIPNAVEVVYSSSNGSYSSDTHYALVVNDDPNSPTSTVNRGRRITHRITSPDFVGIPSQRQVAEYAKQTLKDLSAIEYTVTYTHGYCPVRVGDCVRLNYEKAGLHDVKAKVIRQSIKCEPGCPVTETAVFTKKLWG